MTTIKDIAKYTGVSATTVSNVIHNRRGRVSDETLRRIRDAMQELNYVPNLSARSLVSHSSRVIAWVNHVSSSGHTLLDDPFSTTMIRIIENFFRDRDYYIMIRSVETAGELEFFIRNWNIDGLFAAGVLRGSFLDSIHALEIPTIFIDTYSEFPNICNIGLEDYRGSYLATAHLIENGHRRIAFASPKLRDDGVIGQRFLGYRAALVENGIPFDETLVFERAFDLDSSRATARKMAAAEGITGIVCTADYTALCLMAGLRECGLRIPEDISIVGFDDLVFSRLAAPPLTTVHQDMELKGRMAAEAMLELLQGGAISGSVVLPCRLVERASVRNLLDK